MKLFALKKMTLIGLLFFSLAATGFGAETGRKVLHGHVPRAVAHLTPKGLLAATNRLMLAIGLPLHNQAELDEFLRQIYDPGSTNYHKYLTPEEFTARFGPTEADYAAVKNFARTNGLTITGTFANRMLLDVAGRVPAVEKAFHITLRVYRHPTEKRDFFAPDTEPTVDANLPITDVSGLDNYSPPKPNLHPLPPTTIKPHVGSGSNGGYMGDDFRTAYVPGTTLDGSGQMVGLLQFDGFYSNDIVAYENQTGRTNIPVQAVLLDNVSGVPGYLGIANGNTEVSLDIEMSISMAPALAHVFVFEGNSQNDILNSMASSNLVKNLSSSWGWGSGPSTTTDNIFKIMAAQGQSFFDATGDSDAFSAGTADVNAPSTSPYIMQVGGTFLNTSSAGGSYDSETVWNRGGGVGTSGGISTYYAIPTWQQGISSFANNDGSPTTRNVPDVALTAEDVYVLYGNNSPAGEVGGTSCAAPLWAGFMALVNQQAAANSQPSAGFINPAIYELANESIYTSVFHDTTVGNNTWTSSPNSFYAVPGYDLCTGLGSPVGTNLINALLNPDPLIVVSNRGFAAVGTPAGKFNLTAQTFFLTNIGTAPLTWSLVNTSAWLDVSGSTGALDASAGTTVIVSLNSVGTNLPAGTYSATLGFSDDTSGVIHYRQFTLTTSDPLVITPANNFSFVGPVGGPFIPDTQQIILTNAKSDVLNWSLANTSPWFDVSPSSGSLTAGTSTNLIFSLTPTGESLSAGIYSAVFQVTNLSSEFVQMITGNVVIGQALVQNGGFETGDFTGWALNGDGYNANYVDSSGTYIAPHLGSFCALLGEPSVLAYLSQTLPTSAGQKYLLSLWLNNPLNGSFSNPNEFKVTWNGATIYDKKNIAKFDWSQLQFIVTATGSSTVLQIGGRDDNYYLGLDDVSLVPGSAPVVMTQPTDVSVLAGSNANFSATVTGSTNLVYQWRKNGVNLANGANITGATSNMLTLANVSSGNAGNYSLFVTNIFGVVTSSVAALTIWLPPAIASSSLTNRTIQCSSNNLSFAVNVSGTSPLNFQWSLDGTPVENATNSSFSLTNISLPDHIVAVAVTNLYGGLVSNAVLTVLDTLAPIIVLNGNNPITLELGEIYSDPGATATDVCAGTIPVTVNGVVNTNVVGTNTLIYSADDGNGNIANVTRTVIVHDTTPPEIAWSFTNLVLAADTNCSAAMPDVTGTNFILATDLSEPLTIVQSPTNNSVLSAGTNEIVLTVMDASGNLAYSTNQIIVRDETPPVITLNGGDLLFSELGQTFADPGAIAIDACAGMESVVVSGFVDTNTIGTNALIYTADDGSGNTNTTTRTVIVRDTTPPEIAWSFTNLIVAADTNCSAAMPDVTGTNFILATDLSGPLMITQNPTNNSLLPIGTNLVVIVVADAFENMVFSTNTIVVADQTAPAITLNGGDLLFSELGQTFSDPGAIAIDACAGMESVVVSGLVDTNTIGTNTLIYTADDGSGNTNIVTRIVSVRDTMPPEIAWNFTNLVLAADTNCSAAMPDVTGTNFILATDLSEPLTIVQSPTNNSLLPIGTNFVVIAVADAFDNVVFSTNTIVVADETAPLILSQPQSLTNDAGTTASFEIAADACTPETFQWFFNQTVLDGQINNTLTFTNINLSVAGNYFVVVTASGGTSTSEVATLTVNLLASTLALDPSANPSGFNDDLTFTATVTPASATGLVQFFTNGAAFDSATLVSGQAVSTNLATLPRGTNFVTAIYAGDADDLAATNLLLQIVTNHPPIAATAFYANGVDFMLTIPIVSLAKDWSDVDGDPVSLAEVNVSTNGIILTNNGVALIYFNTNRVADQFTCTITDNFGGTNFQLVNVAAAPPDPAPNIVSVTGASDGSVTLNLVGASGYTYILETTTNLFPFADWQPIATNILGTNNVWEFNDAQATNFSQRFYRLELVP